MLNISLEFPGLSKSIYIYGLTSKLILAKKFEIFARISKCFKIERPEFGRLNTKNEWIETLTL